MLLDHGLLFEHLLLEALESFASFELSLVQFLFLFHWRLGLLHLVLLLSGACLRGWGFFLEVDDGLGLIVGGLVAVECVFVVFGVCHHLSLY